MLITELKGKTVLITGASKDIGLAAAHVFAKSGCHLHLAARDGAALAVAQAEIVSTHDVQVTIHPMDLAAPGAMKTLADSVGTVDILINNAGDIPSGPLESLDFDAVRFNAPDAHALLSVPASTDSEGARFMLNFELGSDGEVCTLAQAAVEEGAELVKAPYLTYYQRFQAVLRDPEGNVFRLNFSHPVAASR